MSLTLHWVFTHIPGGRAQPWSDENKKWQLNPPNQRRFSLFQDGNLR